MRKKSAGSKFGQEFCVLRSVVRNQMHIAQELEVKSQMQIAPELKVIRIWSLRKSPRIGVGLVFYFLLLTSCFSLTFGASQTLRPVANESVNNSWTNNGCSAAWDCINDVTADDDATYLYGGASNIMAVFRSDSTFATNIDSIVIYIRAKAEGTCTGCLNIGWATYGEGLWNWDEVNDTTVTLTTSYVTFHYKPSGSWIYQDINAKKFGFGNNDIDDLGDMVTQQYVVVYYTPAAGKKLPGGVIQDENNQGVAEGGIAR
jgi:hypothetical protein